MSTIDLRENRSVTYDNVAEGSAICAIRESLTCSSQNATSNSSSSERPSAINYSTRTNVSVRVRPLNRFDREQPKQAVHVDLDEGNCLFLADSNGRLDKAYKFDNVFVGGQQEVYDTIGAPMLHEAFQGFHVCLFAYGQTGSGKTHSMLGDLNQEDQFGIVPRFVREMFLEAQRRVENEPGRTVKFSLSMIEIYKEKVRDLLVDRVKGVDPEALELHEDMHKRVSAKNASVHSVLSVERVMQLLEKGNSNRQTAETKMNEASSRSHSILQITISQLFEAPDKRDIESVVSLVDLSGSERVSKTEASGLQLEEAKKINHSLLMLGRALNSFSDKRGDSFLSLRESKLTRILSDCFGGNSKTWMLATISPSTFNLSETLSTLEYATHAMAITNKAQVNKLSKEMELKEYKNAIAELRLKIERLRGTYAELVDERNRLQKNKQDLQEMVEYSALEADQKLLSIIEEVHMENDCIRQRMRHPFKRVAENGALLSSFHRVFVGRCGTSMEDVLLGRSTSLSLPLLTHRGVNTGATLQIKVSPVSPTTKTNNFSEVVGKDVQFVVHVISARNIPAAYSKRIFCKYSLRHDEDDRWYRTTDVSDSQNPYWNFVKHFKIVSITEAVAKCFSSENVFVFEVFAFTKHMVYSNPVLQLCFTPGQRKQLTLNNWKKVL